VLVVADVTATSRELVGALKQRAVGEPTTFTLIIPASRGRAAAHAMLAEALEHLRDQGLEVSGSVGHTDPLVAVVEAWDTTRYDEIIVSTLPADISKWHHAGLTHRIEKLTGASVRHVVSRPPRPPVQPSPAPAQGRSGVAFDPISVLRSGTAAEVSTRASAEAITIAEHETELVAQANASGRQPVVFIHGLWLLPSSWNRWATVFEEAGYVALTPGWPDDPETVEEARAKPELFAYKTIGQVANHFAVIIGKLEKKPALIGHSFGGLLAQIIAGRGLAAVSVAIDPAPFRGVLPLPISALKSARPVLGNPANRNRAVPLTYDQFRYAFANAVSEDEANELYEQFAVPASAVTLFQAAAANLNPWTEAKVDTENPERGPLLIISGEKNHAVPWAIANAAYKHQKTNESVTEIVKMPGRGHALTIDSGWRDVAATALEFVRRFAAPTAHSPAATPASAASQTEPQALKRRQQRTAPHRARVKQSPSPVQKARSTPQSEARLTYDHRRSPG
jgi:pimeloyl-ACP methyl ester carboxylesterase